MDDTRALRPEDYEEPVCPFDPEAWTRRAEGPLLTVPVDRVLRELDKRLGRNDYDGARALLDFWLKEAREGRDRAGELTLRNELMGLCRKQGQREEALAQAASARELLRELGMEHSVTAGTTLLNAATVDKAFGRTEEALALYEQARALYESLLPPGDERLGGLYNNMALALTDAGRYEEARSLYRQAMEIMGAIPGKEPEEAISWLNLADNLAAEQGREAAAAEISHCLAAARALLDTPALPRDGNYAFVCEKCAPTFAWYDEDEYAAELFKRSEEIYAGA